MEKRRFARPRRAACGAILLSLVATTFAHAAAITSAAAPDLPEVARSVARGAGIRIEAAALAGFSDAASLDLQRFDVAADGARFVAQTDRGPVDVHPDLPVFLRGSVDGLADSVVVLSVRASGEMRGIVSGTGGTWMLGRKAGAGQALHSRHVDRAMLAASPHSFSCDEMPNPSPPRAAPAAAVPPPSASLQSAAPSSSADVRSTALYTAQIAVEMDYDYYQTFAPDADGAILYALDLMAFTGVLGQAELNMNVEVPFVQIWTTASDPYSSGGQNRLEDLRTRWNAAGVKNCGGQDCTQIRRSTVILLSSAATGGIAYVPGLCDSWHSPNNGFSYAYTGSISGSFDINSPSAVWDIVASSHELGHNFGSVHTHCYSPPVDDCYSGESGCYSGPTSLPAGCPGPGQGCGTIMSYCHLLGGGMENISLTYGAGHPYGTEPDRVPAEMISRIATEAAVAPGCLTATPGMIELRVDKSGSGGGAVTSSPAGIDCGSACRSYFNGGSTVTLTATPDAFSRFAGWSGDADCSDGVVILGAGAHCTATFVGTCGASNEDCDDANPCTSDSCAAGHCVHAETPRDPSTCLAAGSAHLKILDQPGSDSDRLSWQWGAGAAFAQPDLGSPSSDTGFDLCVYDSSGSSSRLAMRLALPPGGSGWRNFAPRGWSWIDGAGSLDGIRKLSLKPGADGRSKTRLGAGGPLLPTPLPFSSGRFFDEDPSVTVQLLSSDGMCWTSSFVAGSTSANSSAGFNASGR
ncbi:MAG TPA: M12 family metallo-peptidase [Candidatus Binatia bacterium]|jgi:hypothetical protein